MSTSNGRTAVTSASVRGGGTAPVTAVDVRGSVGVDIRASCRVVGHIGFALGRREQPSVTAAEGGRVSRSPVVVRGAAEPVAAVTRSWRRCGPLGFDRLRAPGQGQVR